MLLGSALLELFLYFRLPKGSSEEEKPWSTLKASLAFLDHQRRYQAHPHEQPVSGVDRAFTKERVNSRLHHSEEGHMIWARLLSILVPR